MNGSHYTADLTGCNLQRLLMHEAIMTFVLEQVQLVGLHAVAHQSYTFANSDTGPTHTVNGGVTLTVLLAESHICIHTWPELLGVTLDVYVCNFSADNSKKAEQLFELLVNWFEPTYSQKNNLQRGTCLKNKMT
jgi:S-adenosylmethionine decarboxylase